MAWKKLLAALPLVGATCSFAAVDTASVNPTTTIENNLMVTIPSFQQHYNLSLTALALKPGASNLNYVINNKELPAQSPSWFEQEIKPGYSFAFAIGGRYFYETGRDVHLEWTHLHSDTSSTTTADGFIFFLGPDYQIGPDSIPIREAVGEAKFQYDVINLDVGQYVNFGNRVQMRFFAGLTNPYLWERVIATYTGNVLTGDFPGPFSTQQTVTSNFTGLGPRFGIDGIYNTSSGFSFFGEAAFSALIGNADTRTNYISSSQELIDEFGQTYNYQVIEDQSVMQVIPGFDAKLGVNYMHTLNKDAVLTIGLGYQAAVYINAINQYLPASLVEDMSTGGIYVATMNHTQSNYSVQGPYLNATIDFA